MTLPFEFNYNIHFVILAAILNSTTLPINRTDQFARVINAMAENVPVYWIFLLAVQCNDKANITFILDQMRHVVYLLKLKVLENAKLSSIFFSFSKNGYFVCRRLDVRHRKFSHSPEWNKLMSIEHIGCQIKWTTNIVPVWQLIRARITIIMHWIYNLTCILNPKKKR